MVVHNLVGTRQLQTTSKHVVHAKAVVQEGTQWYSANSLSDSATSWLFGSDMDDVVEQNHLERELEDIHIASMDDFLQQADDVEYADEDPVVNRSSLLCTFSALSCVSASTIAIEPGVAVIPAESTNEDSSSVSPTSVVDPTCESQTDILSDISRSSKTDRMQISVEAQWAQDAGLRGHYVPDPFETPLSEYGLYSEAPHRNPNTGTGSGSSMLSEMDWIKLLGNRYKAPRFVVVQRSGCNPHFTAASEKP